MRGNDVIVRTGTKWLSFIIILFSFFIFMSGHNNPGGGFIGGLMAAGALVLVAVAFGTKVLCRLLPLNYRLVTAAGLLIAVLTGVGSFIFDVPFLTHTFGIYHLPVLGETELATATLFDLGVYLTVVGVTMTIILTIGEDV